MSDHPPIPTFDVRDELYRQFARIGRALSNPTRLHLVSLLAQGDKPVAVLAERTGASVASTSAHLKVLQTAHLVASRREGRQVFYRVVGDDVVLLWMALRRVASAHIPDVRETVRRYFEDPDSLSRLEPDELIRKAKTGEIVVLDLRPEDEYAAGHLPGARSIPWAELSDRMGELPRDRRIVAYCRGAYCVMAMEGVDRIRRAGLDVKRLPGSVASWRLEGRPLER